MKGVHRLPQLSAEGSQGRRPQGTRHLVCARRPPSSRGPCPCVRTGLAFPAQTRLCADAGSCVCSGGRTSFRSPLSPGTQGGGPAGRPGRPWQLGACFQRRSWCADGTPRLSRLRVLISNSHVTEETLRSFVLAASGCEEEAALLRRVLSAQ